mmetsp:Transcript_30448/g.42009  ORF Transcript_30448/g.42009 Transcript_30448/m.42009 type:complete len:1139 (-) Transcript_30448:66-3482(-)|eukprot:CAMPEP_0201476326 /NCGR_PEP_ID=MMETSP0151_2-20130828/1551_1 /ASSEMBLY_ACC=CAM_ASM_000257 /TAXON_ID=200890 /ORGANISM="Paramoeba atlantica, Strain 621/1 / CCAP 1560/9" /LENGTH=1138 /DNA_ID=CAMNT_0047856657 /DNA_START=109 /DNA_END=3525 /DNA_ORIENTATION=-
MKNEKVAVCVRLKPLSLEEDYPNVESCICLDGSQILSISPPGEDGLNQSSHRSIHSSSLMTPIQGKATPKVAKTPMGKKTPGTRRRIFELCGVESEKEDDDKTIFLGETTELSNLPWMKTPSKNQSSVNLLRNCMTSMELDSLSPVPHHKSPSVARPTTPTTSKRQEGPKNFAFDSIMGEASSQADVFEQVEPLVSAVMQGYNATIFVYGATGSGKTHTMIGETNPPKTKISSTSGGFRFGEADPSEMDVSIQDDQGALEGILPRSLRYIMAKTKELENKYTYEIHVTFVEIYKDKISDLLNSSVSKKMTLAQKEEHAKAARVEIHEDVKTKTVYLTGSETIRIPVKSFDNAMELVERAKKARKTGKTNCNFHSSRSHAVMIIHIERCEVGNSSHVCVGKLNLVDLAGSERLHRSGVSGDQAQEAIKINSQLNALGNVLSALSNPDHKGPIPYRNSKLTRLLQDSLGGNSKTLFVVNVSTNAANYRETLTSLQYGERAKKIENTPSQNQRIQPGDATSKREIEKLKQSITKQKEELALLQRKNQTLSLQNKKYEDDLMKVYERGIDVQQQKEAELGRIQKTAILTELELQYELEQQKIEAYFKDIEKWNLSKQIAEAEYCTFELHYSFCEEVSSLKSEIESITTEKLHSLEELESKIEEISHLKETFEQLESGKAEAEKELKRLLSAKSNEESDTRDQLFELEKERDQKMKKLHEMENSKEKVEEKVKALTKELKEKTASLNKEIASRDTKISDLQRRLDESTSSSSPDLDTMAKLQEKEQEVEALEEKMTQLKQKALAKVKKLQSKIEELQSPEADEINPPEEEGEDSTPPLVLASSSSPSPSTKRKRNKGSTNEDEKEQKKSISQAPPTKRRKPSPVKASTRDAESGKKGATKEKKGARKWKEEEKEEEDDYAVVEESEAAEGLSPKRPSRGSRRNQKVNYRIDDMRDDEQDDDDEPMFGRRRKRAAPKATTSQPRGAKRMRASEEDSESFSEGDQSVDDNEETEKKRASTRSRGATKTVTRTCSTKSEKKLGGLTSAVALPLPTEKEDRPTTHRKLSRMTSKAVVTAPTTVSAPAAVAPAIQSIVARPAATSKAAERKKRLQEILKRNEQIKKDFSGSSSVFDENTTMNTTAQQV